MGYYRAGHIQQSRNIDYALFTVAQQKEDADSGGVSKLLEFLQLSGNCQYYLAVPVYGMFRFLLHNDAAVLFLTYISFRFRPIGKVCF